MVAFFRGMSDERHGWTTASVDAVPRVHAAEDPTPGFVLVYSRLHAHLPSALPFTGDVTTLGREADNSLSIPEAAVSRYHARVERRGGEWWIVDLGSTNGTVVGGWRVKEHRLVDHDLVRIGDSLFRYAATGVYRYGAYRLDGSVVSTARPVRHGIHESELVGGSQVDAILDRIDKVARTQLSVVVTGESGTGKELVARELHRWSGRQGAFQAINCAALPASLLESELFGYRKGAFTGATSDKMGLVRAAHGGTLFLDEIGDMPLDMQAKLLRVLELGRFERVGGSRTIEVDVRVLAATHQRLEAMVDAGTFREDLYYRLAVLSVHVAPLRERREDIVLLAKVFLERAARTNRRSLTGFTDDALDALGEHDYPGNVRELQNLCERFAILAEGPLVTGADVRRTIDPSRRKGSVELGAGGLTELVERFERHVIESAIAAHGNRAAAARALEVDRSFFYKKCKRLGIEVDSCEPKGRTSREPALAELELNWGDE